jgi:biotin--protein ligase
VLKIDSKALALTFLTAAGCGVNDSFSSEQFSNRDNQEIAMNKNANRTEPTINLSTTIIYGGAGVSERSKKEIPAGLKQLLANQELKVDTKIVGPEFFDNKDALLKTSLLIIPGGADKPYVSDLKGARNEAIKEYILGGGKVLAFCAGAYYLSQKVEFDMGGPLEVSGTRELVAFPGTARGPVFGPYHYGSDEGGRVVELDIAPELKATLEAGFDTTRVYFDGGCEFVDADNTPGVKVLARYGRTPTKSAAIVEIAMGNGKVILCGAHPDITLRSSPLMSSNKESILNTLERHTSEREWLMRALLTRLFTP